MDVGQPGATSFAVFDLGGGRQEFGAGGADFGELVADTHGIPLSEEYALLSGPGRLRVGSVARADSRTGHPERIHLGVWQGRTSAVKTLVYDGKASDVVALFNRFTIGETSAGAAMAPRSRRFATLVRDSANPPDVVQNVPGLGLLDISERAAALAKQVPAWSGAPVRGGELFARAADTAQPGLLLAGDTALTQIYPDAGVSERRLIGGASSLDVTWRPSA